MAKRKGGKELSPVATGDEGSALRTCHLLEKVDENFLAVLPWGGRKLLGSERVITERSRPLFCTNPPKSIDFLVIA